MKKTFLLAACLALMLACGGNGQSRQTECGDSAGCTECAAGNHGEVKVAAGVIKLTTEEFATKVADISVSEWKYLGDKPAIVDFYADWCPPCRMIAPVLDELAKENPDIYIYKVNIDNSPEIAQAYNVVSIPTLLFIPMEGEPKREVGAMAKGQFEKIIKEFLLK